MIDKLKAIINSCITIEQLKTTREYIESLFEDKKITYLQFNELNACMSDKISEFETAFNEYRFRMQPKASTREFEPVESCGAVAPLPPVDVTAESVSAMANTMHLVEKVVG